MDEEFQPPTAAEDTPARPRTTETPKPKDGELFSPEIPPSSSTREEKTVPTTTESAPQLKEEQPTSSAAAEERQRPTEQTGTLELANESRLLSNVRQVTLVGQRAGEGYFSQDSSLFVFQSEREPGNPFFQIYLMNLQNGDLRRVSPGVGKATCPWIHPSKKKVLFASTHLDPQAREKQKAELDQRASGETRRYAWDFDEQYDIFETDLAGGQAKNLTKVRGYDAEGAWAPDGSLIVFASNRHAYAQPLSPEEQASFDRDPSSQVELYLMRADGTQVRRLTTSPGYDGGPFFSADGRKICWRHFSADGTTAEIFTMNVDGSDVRQLTQLNALSWGPYFHPSGDYLIFATNRQGMQNFELYLVDASGASTPARVTFSEGFDGLPVFSPDGKRLAWSSARGTNKQAQIFFAEWNETEARRMLGLPTMPEGAAEEDSAPSNPTNAEGQGLFSISERGLRTHLNTLATEKMDGRLTGTPGERLATDYVASVFQWLGLTPAGDQGSFFQSFTLTTGVSLGEENRLVLHTGKETRQYTIDTDWRPLAFSQTGEIEESEIVFAGYGIVAPAADGYGEYNAYANLDVTDKWVMVFRYLPEDVTPQLRQHLNRYASLRYKAMVARDKGARGLIVVSGPRTQVKEQLVPLSFDASLAVSSIAVIAVADAVAEQFLQPTGKTLKDLQAALDPGTLVSGFAIPDLTLEVTIDIVQEKRTGRNVVARLTAGDTPGKSAVMVGAHVDHLGRGEGVNSLAREDEKGQIHFGADDNASGVAGMLEIAQALTEAKAKGQLRLQRDVLFAAWSGEEVGLLGSSHFARTFGGGPTEPASLSPAITAYLNLDMIGRLDKSVSLQGVGSSSLWPGEIERFVVATGLNVSLQKDSYLPTDSTSFYLKQVPTLNAFTGAHVDYHTPRDTIEKINYEGAAKITRLMAALTHSLATRLDTPDYVAMTQPPTTIGRVNLRAYLGTIPDYTQSEMAGVKLTGVAKGGPAEQAGAQTGDIIIELAGRKVENIYDYTYALDGLKIGTPVEMRVLRNGKPLILKVTPGTRE
jgi:Tol biopolymer transport system component